MPNADTCVAERTSEHCGHIGGRASPITYYGLHVLAPKVPPKRAARWPEEASKTLPERLIAKVLILTPVVVVVVVVVVIAVVVDPPSPLPSASADSSSSSSSTS